MARNPENVLSRVTYAYKKHIKYMLNDLDTKFKEFSKNRELYEQLIINNADKVYSNPVLKTILNHRKGVIYSTADIEELFPNKDTRYKITNNKEFITYVASPSEENNILIPNMYTNFKKFVIFEHNTIQKIKEYQAMDIGYSTLFYLVSNLFKLAGKYILVNRAGISLPHRIILSIKGKSRLRNKIKYNRNIKKIDWNESFNTLKAIAKEDKPDIYNLFETDKIVKNKFIDMMRPYVYNKYNNPNGKKWLVTDDKEWDFWVIISHKYSKLPNLHKYNIVPSNYISPSVTDKLDIPRKQSEFAKLTEYPEDVIDTEHLGMRDKLRMLERYYSQYCFTTFKHNITDDLHPNKF